MTTFFRPKKKKKQFSVLVVLGRPRRLASFCKPHVTDPRVSLSTWARASYVSRRCWEIVCHQVWGGGVDFFPSTFWVGIPFFVTFDRSKFPGTFPVKLDRGERVFFWLRLLLHELNIQKTMPSDWYFGPVVCVCLLSRIFFSSFPRRRPSELPPLKRHFERKRYIYVEIYHRVGSQRESLGSRRRIERENTTRQEKYRRGYYSRRNEKLTLCVENFGVLFNVGGLPPPTENAHPPSFFLFWIWLPNYRWKEQFSFFFLYLPPF